MEWNSEFPHGIWLMTSPKEYPATVRRACAVTSPAVVRVSRHCEYVDDVGDRVGERIVGLIPLQPPAQLPTSAPIATRIATLLASAIGMPGASDGRFHGRDVDIERCVILGNRFPHGLDVCQFDVAERRWVAVDIVDRGRDIGVRPPHRFEMSVEIQVKRGRCAGVAIEVPGCWSADCSSPW